MLVADVRGTSSKEMDLITGNRLADEKKLFA